MIPFKGDDVSEYYYGECYFGKSGGTKEFKLTFAPKAVAVEFEWVASSKWGENWNRSGFVTSKQDCTAPITYLKVSLTEDSIQVTNTNHYVGNVWFAVFDKPIFDK